MRCVSSVCHGPALQVWIFRTRVSVPNGSCPVWTTYVGEGMTPRPRRGRARTAAVTGFRFWLVWLSLHHLTFTGRMVVGWSFLPRPNSPLRFRNVPTCLAPWLIETRCLVHLDSAYKICCIPLQPTFYIQHKGLRFSYPFFLLSHLGYCLRTSPYFGR